MKELGKLFTIMSLLAALLLSGCSSVPVKDKNLSDEGALAVKNPVSSDPILGVGDTIDIAVYRNDDLKKTIKINKSGKIMFPLIGDVTVADRSVYEVRDELQQRLARYIVNPQVTINISTLQSQKVLVLGEVKNPGILTLDIDLSIADAIVKTGGYTSDAKTTDIFVIRKGAGKPETVKFDLKSAIQTGDFTNNLMLRNGDIVYVPTLAMADVSWFMSHLSSIIGPIVTLETGIVLWPQTLEVLKGGKSTTNFSVPTQ